MRVVSLFVSRFDGGDPRRSVVPFDGSRGLSREGCWTEVCCVEVVGHGEEVACLDLTSCGSSSEDGLGLGSWRERGSSGGRKGGGEG